MKIFKFFLFFLMFCYICYHVFCGKRNVLNYFEKRDELARVEAKVEALKARNARLQTKIDHLSDEQIDLDLLEEVSRDVLGTSGAKDEIIILKKN